MSEENKAIARRLFGEGINEGNLSVADELVAPDFINHNPARGATPDREGLKQYVTMLRSAFPDLHGTIEDQIAEGDKVVLRMTFRGTHRGKLMGIPPTGKELAVIAIGIFRFAGGKIVERWAITDELGMMQQLGVIPTPGQG